MKKRIALFLAVLMALLLCTLAACTKDEVKAPDPETLKTYMDANTKEALWKRHQIFRCDFIEYREEEIFETLNYYLDSDYALWDFSRGEKWLYGRDVSLDLFLEGETKQFYAYLSDTDELIEKWLDEVKANEFLELIEADRVVETVDEGDGKFVGVLEFTDPAKIKQVIEENAPDLPEDLEYEEGMAIRYRYTFSTETKDLLGYETILVKAGEEPTVLNAATFFYDGERLDPFAEGELFSDYRAAVEDPVRRRTITFVFDTDTEEEIVREYVLPQHAAFHIYSKGERVEEFYTDRACTKPYEGDDGTEALTLYIPQAD